MFCEKCGTRLLDGDLFCPNCGSRVDYNIAPDKNIVEKSEIEQLVEKLKTGDEIAFSKLYELTYQKAYYNALKILKNEQDAQDILQESYIKAYSSINSLIDNSKFQNWLNCIVINKSKNYIVKKKPTLFSQFENDDSDFDFEDVIENESSDYIPQQVVDDKETQRLIMKFVDSLSEEQRMCIVTFYYDEMSVKEIADALGVSENTVKSRLYLARKNLKKEIENSKINLYGLSVLPLLKVSFNTELENIPVKFSTKIYADIAKACFGTNAVALGTSVGASSVASTSIKIAGVGISKKVIAIVVATTIAVAGTGTGIAVNKKHKSPTDVVQTTKLEDSNEINEITTSKEDSVEPIRCNNKSGLGFVYNGNRYIADYEEQAIKKVSYDMKTEEIIYDCETRNILNYGDSIIFINNDDESLCIADLSDKTLKPDKINSKPLAYEEGPTSKVFWNFYCKDGKVIYQIYDGPSISLVVYDINSKKEKIIKSEEPYMVDVSFEGFYAKTDGEYRIIYSENGDVIKEVSNTEYLYYEDDNYKVVSTCSENEYTDYIITNKSNGNEEVVSLSEPGIPSDISIVGDKLFYVMTEYEFDNDGSMSFSEQKIIKNLK